MTQPILWECRETDRVGMGGWSARGEPVLVAMPGDTPAALVAECAVALLHRRLWRANGKVPDAGQMFVTLRRTDAMTLPDQVYSVAFDMRRSYYAEREES